MATIAVEHPSRRRLVGAWGYGVLAGAGASSLPFIIGGPLLLIPAIFFILPAWFLGGLVIGAPTSIILHRLNVRSPWAAAGFGALAAFAGVSLLAGINSDLFGLSVFVGGWPRGPEWNKVLIFGAVQALPGALAGWVVWRVGYRVKVAP